MKRSSKLVVIVIFAAALLISGCFDEQKSVVRSGPEAAASTFSFDFSAVITVGNRSYIPLNIHDEPANRANLILTLLDEFERKRPEIKIAHWHIEKRQEAYITSDYIFGIWIDHEPNDRERLRAE